MRALGFEDSVTKGIHKVAENERNGRKSCCLEVKLFA